MNTAHKMQLRFKFLQDSSLLSVSHVEEKKETNPKPKRSEENFQIFQTDKRLLRKGDIFWKEYREGFHCR